mmetsp:Transcript_14006/g.50955  ORF Transcript_14006/g.50955 Transcript_14006/m.50955 type:complete len:349 (-) Transcript_14006:578-1624(-)
MDEDDAHRLYTDLLGAGQAAARFKHGLGFKRDNSAVDGPVGGRLPSPTRREDNGPRRPLLTSCRMARSRSRSRTPERHRLQRQDCDRHGEQRYRTRSKSPGRFKRQRERRRSRSRDRELARDRYTSRRRSTSRDRSRERRPDGDRPRRGTDYSKCIRGWDRMSAHEKMKARTRYHLSHVQERSGHGVTNDADRGWERFLFNKSAPLDDDLVANEGGEQHRLAPYETRNESGTMAQALRQIHSQGAFHFSAATLRERTQQDIDRRHESAVFGARSAHVPEVHGQPQAVCGEITVPEASHGGTISSSGLVASVNDDEDAPVLVTLAEASPTTKPSAPSWRTLRKPKLAAS